MGTFCYGEDAFNIKKRPEIEITTSITNPLKPSLKNQNISFSNIISFDFSSLYFDYGFSFSQDYTDSVVRSFVNPFYIGNFRLGAGFGFHLYDYYKSFLEQDFISGIYCTFIYKNVFTARFIGGNLLKFTTFKNSYYSSLDSDFFLFNSSWFIGFHFDWNIHKLFNVYLDVKSVDFYDYSLLGTPFFKLGFSIDCTDNFSIGANYLLKMIDMIAVSAAPSEMLLTFYTEIRL